MRDASSLLKFIGALPSMCVLELLVDPFSNLRIHVGLLDCVNCQHMFNAVKHWAVPEINIQSFVALRSNVTLTR